MGACLTFPSICFLPVVYVFSHAQGERPERGSCANSLCDALRGAFGHQHDWRRKLSTLYRSTARLTQQATTVCFSRSPSCRASNLEGPSYSGFGVYARVYIECHQSESPHGSLTWRTGWIYIDGVAWRLYECFRRIRAMVTPAVTHCQREYGDVRSTQCPDGAAGTTDLSLWGGTIILECGSCASI